MLVFLVSTNLVLLSSPKRLKIENSYKGDELCNGRLDILTVKVLFTRVMTWCGCSLCQGEVELGESGKGSRWVLGRSDVPRLSSSSSSEFRRLEIISIHRIILFPPSFSFSVEFSCSVMSDSLRPCESQHARLPCPSPTPRVHSNSRPSSWWCHPAISSSVVPFSSPAKCRKASTLLTFTELKQYRS